MGSVEGGCQPSQARRVVRRGSHVFADAEALDGPDIVHSVREERCLRLGRSLAGRVLMVAYTLRRSGDVEKIRIISARRASRTERASYRSDATD